ncbi:MAG: hypothetical protein IPK19_14980 [Chloroflexi bacterium]|nr:hypothetical protein [Chloroflexota bacterium]
MSTNRHKSRADLNRFLWNALWRLYPPVSLAVGASSEECLRTLSDGARPSTARLHLRDLFVEGRRYYIMPKGDGFKITSDNRPLWGRRRQRTPVSAYLNGSFTTVQGSSIVTLVRLDARMYRLSFFGALALPTFFTSIVVFMPWDAPVLGVLIAAMYVCSLLGHRVNAALQVNEMVYFVQKVFEDLPPAMVAELPDRGPEMVVAAEALPNDDFAAEWARYYREHSS